MLDAAPFQHGFQSVPFPRVDRQPVLHLHRQHAPGEPTLVVLRLPFGRVLGDLLVALQPPGRQRQVIQVAREAAARQPPPRSRRRVLSCQQPAGTVRPCSAAGGLFEAEHALGVGPGLGQSFRRRRPPHCAERRAPIRGVTSGSPAPFTLRHGAKQLTRFTTARPASPAPLAGSRCSRPSPRPAALACGPGRPCAAAPACAPAAPPAPGASCPDSGLLERRDTPAVARLASLGDRPRVLKRLIACLGERHDGLPTQAQVARLAVDA